MAANYLSVIQAMNAAVDGLGAIAEALGGSITAEPVVLIDDGGATGDAVADVTGGQYVFAVQGEFDGAVVTAQILGPDAATWMDLATLDAPGFALLRVWKGATVRGQVTGGGAPAGLFAQLLPA